jgi:predicted dehydrogenase
MQRRDFIKNTGLASGGLFIPKNWVNPFFVNNNADKINIAIIGCGERGKGLISVLQQLSNQFVIAALCDVLPFRFKEVETIMPFNKEKCKENYQVILDDKNIGAVIIATPLHLHFSMAKDALLAGKHVYVEKTMTYNIAQALELVQLQTKYPKQVIQVGHQYRYSPLYFKVKEMIEKDYLGKVTQIDCRWDRNGSWRRKVTDASLEKQINWRMYKAYSGGLVAELLSHQIDFINWAFNTHPDEILGTGGIDFYKDGRETNDNVQVVLRYNKANMIGNFGATCANARDGYLFKIKGTKGMVSLLTGQAIFYPEKETLKEYKAIVDGVTGATKITWDKDGGTPVETEPLKDGSWYALDNFYDCIIKNREPFSNVKTGCKTAITVHLANKAIEQHTIEIWPTDYNN